MTNIPNIARVITRDRVFKHKKTHYWTNVFLNQPKLSENINIEVDLYVTIKVSTNYVASKYVNRFLRNQKKNKRSSIVEKLFEPFTSQKNNKTLKLELATTLSEIDETIESCMGTMHKTILQIGDYFANIKNNVCNVEVLENDHSLINNYTFIQLDNSKTAYLDTGEIKLWTNQQDLAFYLIDREYYYNKFKHKIIDFKNEIKNKVREEEEEYEIEIDDRISNYFRTTINLSNPKELSNTTILYDKYMEIKHYLHGKSYPLLASIKSSMIMNKVVIITSCPLISYQWAKYCEKMRMTYEVVEDREELSSYLSPVSHYSPTDTPCDIFEGLPEGDYLNNRQVVIIELSHYISETLNRNIFESIGKCIVDIQAVNLSTLRQYEINIQSLSDYLLLDRFDTVYNLSDKYIPEPRVGIFGCNNSYTMNQESFIMPAVRIYDDNTIKIHNEYFFIRKDQICSIILVNFKNDDNCTEEELRFDLKLPTFLTLYKSAKEYVRDRLKIKNNHPNYNNKMQQVQEKECKICFLNFENEIENNQAIINYSCCGSNCCLSCFNLNFSEKKMDAFKCFNCRATEQTTCEECVIDSYLEKCNVQFKTDTRVLVLGAFPTKEMYWKVVQEYIFKWFESDNGVPILFDLFDDPLSFKQLQNKNYDRPNGAWAVIINTNEYRFNSKLMSFFPFKPIHVENINTVVFLPSVPSNVKQMYMNSFCCSSTELKIYHFQVEEPNAYI